MAVIHETNAIDLILTAPDGSAYLAMIKDDDWDISQDLPDVRAKLNTYAYFILDGDLVEHTSGFTGQPVTIALHSTTTPPSEIQEILDLAKQRFAHFGISVDQTLITFNE